MSDEQDLVAELARCKQELHAATSGNKWERGEIENAKLKRHIDSVENQLQAAWDLIAQKTKLIEDLQARLDKSIAGESAAYAKWAEAQTFIASLKRDFGL